MIDCLIKIDTVYEINFEIINSKLQVRDSLKDFLKIRSISFWVEHKLSANHENQKFLSKSVLFEEHL